MTKNEIINEAIKAAQRELGLTDDGDFGPVTTAKAAGFDIKFIAVASPIVVTQVSGDWFGAPWIGANIDLLGRYEDDPELNARYVPEWKLEGLPQYKTLMGNTHAWCILRWNADRRKVGIKGTNSAAAKTMSDWEVKCPFWFGAGLDIAHTNNKGQVTGRHAADFLYWIDEKNGICATLDGNRGNRFAVNRTDISGRPGADKLMTGPRGHKGWVGQSPTMAEVIAKYPMLKVTGTGSSTR